MTKEQILAAYKNLYLKLKKFPIFLELQKEGVSERQIRTNFGSLGNLKSETKQAYPEAFANVIDSDFLTKKNFKKIKDELLGYKKFVITTAVNGCDIHEGFFSSIYAYCHRNNAALIILPSNDPAHNLDNKYEWNFDPKVKQHLVFDDMNLNTNLMISCVKTSAKMVDPVLSLARVGQRSGSLILASPKQRLKMVPTSNYKLPHAVMTTGALTTANYKTNKFFSERSAYLSHGDHILGALIVEIEDAKLFHFRQIQAANDGSFFDINKKYKADGTIEAANPKAIVLGDYHSGETDPIAENCWINLIKETNPEIAVFHDLYSGKSTSHHDSGNIIKQAIKANNKQLNLEDELKKVCQDLNKYTKLVNKIVIAKGNHDIFLDRYLSQARYIYDPHNHLLALKLAIAMIEGNDPLKFAIEMFGVNNKEKIQWLSLDEDYKICGIQLGAHGHCGANGAKGSLKAMEAAYGQSISGHSHSPEILRGSWQVGTSTRLKLDYNHGPSSWAHTSCLVFPNGMRQLINCINGKYKI